ncbi:hypothetical protein LTR62_001801 [Meristemomyces frigidus]|uniref:Metallo-beta-lactamase domain-containing protein n=1 Tax=Meristemomyces frigidus TaxID=1508187 RepID=A0AAN7TLE7_9PEZI|nr:hypothetical protein LTR62_001801 [Meristemomyces frigidus]
MADLVELDSLEILVIVDNELDPISPSPNAAVQQSGGLKDIGMGGPQLDPQTRGGAISELRMDNICCSAHGLSLLITGLKSNNSGEPERHTVLFDTGPEEHIFELNATRLKARLGEIETIQLSHWHRDHSGGMPRVLAMANAMKPAGSPAITVDLNPDRPDYRGMVTPMGPVSMEADPTFAEIEAAGGKVEKHSEVHTVAGKFFAVSGEIPRTTSYDVGLKRGLRMMREAGVWEEDTLIRDERFLMCKLKDKGIVMFTGCSHAGVVNASRHAVTLGNGVPLYAVMGGFHLADGEPQTITSTVADLQALEPKLLLTGHCTGWRAKFAIQQAMPGKLVPSFVGSRFTL